MIKNYLITAILSLVSVISFAQNSKVSGTVTDKVTGDRLVGVNIVYGEGKGMITDVDGNFSASIPYGTYVFKVSYVGYNVIEKSVVLNKPSMTINFSLENKTLDEVEIVADMARTRETPVAFSNIKPGKIAEELGAQDLPMILNSTPGVYATQQGGGDGDARINIRGFNQRNVAVMIDGVPVNDMENGWVYWSNWSGLDLATKSIQVQRGLGASKLALPSFGGTMNLLTQGIVSKKGLILKGEVGSDGYLRTSLAMTTGKLPSGWGVTFTGFYKQGNGWVDMTWSQAYFYFLRVDKSYKNHLFSFTAIGAPQKHGQRAYMNSIAEFDTAYAAKVGVHDTDYVVGKPVNLGLRYNQNWAVLERWGLNGTDTVHSASEKVNEKMNYYHKPQYTIRHFWQPTKNFYLSNIAYLSVGSGGGTGFSRTLSTLSDGTKDLQYSYDVNMKNLGTALDGKGDYIYSSVNNHRWVGVLSSFGWEYKRFEFSGGIDLRDYKGEHYREIYDLLGQSKFVDVEAKLTDKTNPSRVRALGDKVYYNNDGLVRWGGLYGQVNYKSGNWTAFFNATFAVTGYQRVDYFRKKDLVIGDTIIKEAVGYDEKFIFPPGTWLVVADTFEYNGTKYTINSSEARTASTGWKWIKGYTFKGGFNYNISETQNAFFNAGYLNKAPRFSNVYDNSNQLYKEIENELIKAAEVGYSFYNKKISLNFNAYITSWENKPADAATSVIIDDITYKVNINGMDALHKGFEVEFDYKFTKQLSSSTIISIGDWRWTSADTAEIVDDNTDTIVKRIYFNAKGVRVGDAAQTQLRQSFRWSPVKGFYISVAGTYFGQNYSDFDPLSLDPVTYPSSFDENGNPKQSWRIPDYVLFDAFAGYKKKFDKFEASLQFAVLNVLNTVYISDAQNNDTYTNQGWSSFDARSAGVFFGMGRRFTTSLTLKF